jgi:hypothetical protein
VRQAGRTDWSLIPVRRWARVRVEAISDAGFSDGQGWFVRCRGAAGNAIAAGLPCQFRCRLQCLSARLSATGGRRSRAVFGFPAAGQGRTWQAGSPGRGPQAASQAPWLARTASRSRHRSSGVIQCGWVDVPPVTARSAAASRRADGEPPACTIASASRIVSSISRSVMLVTSNHLSNSLHIRKPHQGTSRQIGGRCSMPALTAV